MLSGCLVSEDAEGKRRRVPIGDSIIIGRTNDCGFIVQDESASRHHVVITRNCDRFHMKDQNSTNGTLLNDVPTLEAELKSGDRIRIGNTTILFELEDIENAPAPAHEKVREETPVFLGTMLDPNRKPDAASRPSKAAQLLHAACSVTNSLASNYDPCALVDQILETAMKAIDAQRGAVFFSDARGEVLQSCPECNRIHLIEDGCLRKADAGEIQISQTVARRVIQDGESVLIEDTSDGGELGAAESIVALQLRSIVCVPLRGKSGILGILYVDTDRAAHRYSEEDLLLITAVGNSAGLAIDNANMHREILDKQRIEQDIRHAWIIQEGFLVKTWPEDARGFEVYGETRPAKVVGGDFYDFIEPRPGQAAILIGDVSGKGVSAALTMAQLLAAFRVLARDIDSPAELLETLNDDLVLRSRQGMFCTLCYLTVDLAGGAVRCANAGHQPALHIGAGGASFFAEASGPPAGVLPELNWQEAGACLEPGDTVLLYTDGVTEARSGMLEGIETEFDEYGLDRLRDVASGLHGAPPKELIETINKSVIDFSKPKAPHDDCTMIGLRYAGPP